MNRLEELLKPKTLAVVGASEGNRHGGAIMRALRDLQYNGKVIPVNPNHRTVYDLPAYASLREIEEPIDCVAIAVNSRSVLSVLEEAAQIGAKAAFIVSAGFAEIGEEGRELQRKIGQFAAETGMRIGGPNSIGFINMNDRTAVYSGSIPESLCAGSVGVLSQSGSICGALTGVDRGLCFSYLISSGNEVNVKAAEYIDFMLNDPNTRVVLGFIEGIKDPDQFVEVADRALEMGKPIVLLKVGRSERGKRATMSHTGSMAGSDAIYEALFKQKGIIRVDDLDELLEMGQLFSILGDKRPRGDGIGLVTLSGGETALIHDVSEPFAMNFPTLTDKTQGDLKGVLPGFAVIGNPLDMTGAGATNQGTYERALSILSDDKTVDLVAVMQNVRRGQPLAQRIAESLVKIAKDNPKPFVFFSNISRGLSTELQRSLAEGGIPLLQGARESIKAISALTWYTQMHLDAHAAGKSCEDKSGRTDEITALLRSPTKRVLTEREAKAVLARYGIRSCKEVLATTCEEAVVSAQEIGFPVVMKVESDQISHKTDVGGVELNLLSETDVREAWSRMMETIGQRAPDAKINGVVIQEMVTGGVEVLIGMTKDPQFGPVIVFGLGGIFVELMRDITLRMLPLTRKDAVAMIEELRGKKVFSGIRGRPPVNKELLIDTILQVSRLVSDYRDEIDEIDINPLVIRPGDDECIALDALIVRSPAAAIEA